MAHTHGRKKIALIGSGMIPDADRRQEICARLEETGRQAIELTLEQIENFAGNAIELEGADGRVVVMSARALASLRPDQIAALEASARILAFDVPTIELAGGSVRCMLAGVHLTPR